MNLKKFNKETQTWDIIASGNASGIVVTDPHFVNEGDVQKSVNDVLVEMDNKIEQTRRNLSWVVLNGTIGGGGGGGSTDAELIISHPNLTVVNGANTIYATSEKLVLGCLVKSVRSNQKYYVSLTMDNQLIYNRELVLSNYSKELIISNIAAFSDQPQHTVTITCEDENGIALDPFFLTVTESSIKLSVDKTMYNAQISEAAPIRYYVTNKVLHAETSLLFVNETIGFENSIEIGLFTQSSPMAVDVDFFKQMFPESYQHVAGTSYTISAYAQTLVSGQPVNSNKVEVQVVVQDSDTLVVLTSGITDITNEEESIGIVATQFEQSGSIYFSFTPYFAGSSVVYYSLRLQRGVFNSETGLFEINELKTPIDIGIFDATKDNFDLNQSVMRGTTKVFSWKIQEGEEWIGDYLISLKCWSASDFEIQTTKKLLCTVIRSSGSMYPMQMQPYSLFAQWHINQYTFPSNPLNNQWVSIVDEYKKPGDTALSQSTQYLNVYDTNGTLSGFITNNNQRRLRLANEAYGVIDVKPFEHNPDRPEGVSNWGKSGFTLSLTFKADQHPFTDRTIFFIGQYDSDGNFSEGIYVGLETVIWKYHDGSILNTVSCKIQLNQLTSIDFVLDRKNNEESGELKIFVNGVLNVAREVSATTTDGTGFRFVSPSKMYLGCSCLDESTKQVDHFADVEFYDISLFTYPLNDFQIVINSMNSRAKGSLLSDGSIDYTLYSKWRADNFMDDPDVAGSMLWAGDMEINAGYRYPNYQEWRLRSHIPVIHVTCSSSGAYKFTKLEYEKINAPTDVWYPECTFQYYDPSSKKEVSFNNASIAIQGTSSAGYRSKNIEIKFIDERTNKPVLFRPVESWLPESQFTMKADVVDSAHANNASIGKWINDNATKLFENTPPMQVWDANKPVNCGIDGLNRPFSDKMKIKHTLEGFPVILLMTFANTSQPEMLGIYSFNLGRAAYYNMGMKFLKNFTHDEVETELKVDVLPAFVTQYEEYTTLENFGNIKQSEIYSYEFGLNENVSTDSNGKPQYTALFMQDNESVLKHIGEFKFNGANSNDPSSPTVAQHVWDGLRKLFTVTASMTNAPIPKYSYDSIANGYVKLDDEYNGISDYGPLSAELADRLSVNNAYSYFMICIAFGLVDSLGKNMVLRSWNVQTEEGKTLVKWWPCFYDMDTATGLANTGEEDVPKTAYIDKFENRQVEEGTNQLQIILNSFQGGYDTYSSRLWDILRHDAYLGATSNAQSYENIWANWRQDVDLIGMDAITGENGIKKFINTCFKAQTDGCGELLYNYDYRIKYLTKYKTQSFINGSWVENPIATYGNVHFLHGTRVNYVSDWLNRRAVFFDGVFDYSGSNILPYNNIGKFACGGGDNYMKLTVKTNSPVIMRIEQESGKNVYKYFVDENIETQLIAGAVTGNNSQVALNNLSEINMLGGLKDQRLERFMDSFTLYSLAELDLSNNKTFSGGDTGPIDFTKAFLKYVGIDEVGQIVYSSDLRHLNLSNTAFRTTTDTTTFPVVIDKYDKLKSVDISNGCVTSISLPKASLSDLKINNSDINEVSLIDQAFLTEVNFRGCNKLTTAIVRDCAKLETLDLSGLPNLTTVDVSNCPSLKSINVSQCSRLIKFQVTGAPELTSIDLSGCSSTALEVNIFTSSKLNTLNLSNTKTAKPIVFTAGFNSLTDLDLHSSNVTALQFGNASSIAKYNDEYVLDLSMFDLTRLNVQYNSMKYIKFKNSKSTPYKINKDTFAGCTNLTRVFGHIDLTTDSCFYNPGVLSNFTVYGRGNDEIPVEGAWYGLNSDPKENGGDGLDAWINTKDLQTNITVSATSLASMFVQTACNMFDVYDILWRCTDKVTSLTSAFSGCKNCVTDMDQPLRRDTFKKCSNVRDISSIFYSTNVGGPLYSPSHNGDTVTAYDGLFSYLPKLTTLNSAFQNGKKFYIDDLLFYNCANNTPLLITSFSSTFGWNIGDNITIVTNTTGINSDNLSDREGAYARASKLLRYLPNLTSISDTFNNIWMHFDTEIYEGVTYCPLLAYNTKISSLTGFLLNIKVKNNSDLRYLFGGHEVFDNFDECKLFSRSITTLNGVLYVSSYDTKPAYFPIHNSMFKQISNSLRYISNYSDNNNVCAYPNTFSKTTASFNGVGLDKRFLQEESEIFPLDVFTKCVNLIRVKYLFYGLTTNLPTTAEELFLPGDMFKNNKQLTHVDGCFANMSSDIKYTLTGRGTYNGVEYAGFKNCKLTCVRYCFDEGSIGKGNKVGGIPYGLFYQEKQTTKTFTGWTPTDYENDGVSIDTAYPTGSQPSTHTYKVIVTEPNNIITDMTGALRYFAGTDASCFTAQLYDLKSLDTAGDYITVNPNYDPRKYIQSSTYDGNETYIDINGEEQQNPNYNPYFIVENPNYDPCKYTWNIYYLDGSKNFGEEIEKSQLYSKVLDGSIPDIHVNIPSELYDTDVVSGTMTGDRSDSRNYICPPDLFRYCANSISNDISVAYVLANSTHHTSGSNNRLSNGIYGRIPSILFRPISNVKKLENVFNSCRNITPHLWGTDESVGQMFPSNLFEYNKSLTSVSGIFAGIYIPSNVAIPNTLFLNNTNLNNASYLFYDCVCNYTGLFDSTMFTNNRYLNNISYMFAASSNSSPGTNNNIKQIEYTLFTKDKNPNLNNVSGFLMYQGNTRGTVPEFWKWAISTNNRLNVFTGVSKSIGNYADIPADWASGMI